MRVVGREIVLKRSRVLVGLCECILNELLKVDGVRICFIKMSSEGDDFVIEFCVVAS